jgi:hypothetical protein
MTERDAVVDRRVAVTVPSASTMLASMIASGFTLRAVRAWTEAPLPAGLQDDPRLAHHAREHQDAIRRLLPVAARYRRLVVRVLRADGNMSRPAARRLAEQHQRLVGDLGPVLANAALADTARRWAKKHGGGRRCSARGKT